MGADNSGCWMLCCHGLDLLHVERRHLVQDRLDAGKTDPLPGRIGITSLDLELPEGIRIRLKTEATQQS